MQTLLIFIFTTFGYLIFLGAGALAGVFASGFLMSYIGLDLEIKKMIIATSGLIFAIAGMICGDKVIAKLKSK